MIQDTNLNRSSSKTISLLPGDGVGPEVIESARRLIDASGVTLTWEVCEAGKQAFHKGISSGVPQDTLDSIARNKIALKGPLETPVGYGAKSANVMLRKLFDTYGNIRPIRSFDGVLTPFSDRTIDCIIVRENIEDLYAGIEHQISPDSAQALKIMTVQGCRRIVRLAFELARAQGRQKVHCATKANILKLTEGLLKRVFEEIAPEYPDIESAHLIVDNCAHQLVRFPEKFDVIVMSNMNGDILSDMASGLIGGLGFAPGANLGQDVSIFEAVHGSAPRYAGQNTINPTAVILSGVMMLRHLEEFNAADLIENALRSTLKKGIHTQDVPGISPLSTTDFTDTVLREMDDLASGNNALPDSFSHRSYRSLNLASFQEKTSPPSFPSWRRGGLDVFLTSTNQPDALGTACASITNNTPFRFVFLDNRGFVMYPSSGRAVACTSNWRARFICKDSTATLKDEDITLFLNHLSSIAPWGQVEILFFDGDTPLFTKAQGE